MFKAALPNHSISNRACGWSRFRFQDSLPCLVLWFPTALLLLVIKWTMLNEQGFAFFSAKLGRDTCAVLHDHWRNFNWLELISFFRADLLEGFVLIPIGLLLAVGVLKHRWRYHAVGIISLAVSFGLYIELHELRSCGRFVAAELAWEGMEWGSVNKRALLSYLFSDLSIVPIGLLAMLLALWFCGPRAGWTRERASPSFVATGFALFAGFAALGFLVSMPRSNYHRGVLRLAWNSFLGDKSTTAARSSSTPSATELTTQYHQLVGVARPLSLPEHWAEAQGYDLILFILETAPARSVSFDDQMDQLPNLKKLRAQAWIGTRHFTSFPNTIHAHYSVLTSEYPPNDVLASTAVMASKSFVQKLKAAGYRAKLYGDQALDPGNRGMYQALGFPIENQTLTDNQSLQMMLDDIKRWANGNQRYVALFIPQIGHGPWIDQGRGELDADPPARRRSIAQIEDGWIGALMQQLERAGRLERTLIVVTGDHGVRDTAEDPAFRPGYLDEYTFQVPFLIYAPGIVQDCERIPWLTSHIDIGPSVLDLFGVSAGRNHEQGSPLWDGRLVQRTTYFWADRCFGVNGFYRQGQFYMYNLMADVVLTNSRMHFDERQNIVPNGNLQNAITANLGQMEAIRQRWLKCSDR